MPSPFPGMDPYLEGDDWTSFHAHFATEIARQLTPRLRPKYVALPQKRFDVVDPSGIAIESIYPDVGVVERVGPAQETMGTAVVAAPFLLQTVMAERAPHTWVAIRDVAGRHLVTTIEILSPWNKRGRGRKEYLIRRGTLLRSSAHLVEIDLLRRGRRLPMREALPAVSYYVVVSRAEQRPMVQVWPIALDHPLPTISVPLLTGDGDISLDLQSCFQNVYDLGGFDLVLDYSKAPPVPLRQDQAAWVDERLRAANKCRGNQ
jgi:hypothetical protein